MNVYRDAPMLTGSLDGGLFGLGLLIALDGGSGWSLEDPEERFHLVVGGRGRRASSTRRGQDRSKVCLGHVELCLQFLHALEELRRSLLRLDPRGPIVFGLPPEVLGAGDRLAGLAAQVNDPLDNGSAQVRVGRPAVGIGPVASGGPSSPCSPAAGGPGDGFGLSRIQGFGVKQSVPAVLDF
jgi:hypothetical protein